MKDKKSSKLKKYLSQAVIFICIGVFVYAGYNLVSIILDYQKGQQVAADVQETYYESSGEKQNDNGDSDIDPKFSELLDDNSDVVGWIYINGTQIDYPIVQSEDNKDYLDQNFYKDDSRSGSIFLDYRNDIKQEDNDRHLVVYGHRMKDGSMFENLSDYLDKDFFDNHQTFEVETLYNSYEAEIFAVYNTTTDFNYIKTDFEDDAEYKQLISDIEDESIYKTDVNVGADDRMITLSTCDYELDENKGRLVVQAKLEET